MTTKSNLLRKRNKQLQSCAHCDFREGVPYEVKHLSMRLQVAHSQKLVGSLLRLALGLFLQDISVTHLLYLGRRNNSCDTDTGRLNLNVKLRFP